MTRLARREQRRSAVRIPVNKLPAEITLAGTGFLRQVRASLVDLSSSGALLELHDVGLLKGTQGVIHFELPGGDRYSLNCVVVRYLSLDDCVGFLAPGASCRLAILFQFDSVTRQDALVRWIFATQAQARRHLRAGEDEDE